MENSGQSVSILIRLHAEYSQISITNQKYNAHFSLNAYIYTSLGVFKIHMDYTVRKKYIFLIAPNKILFAQELGYLNIRHELHRLYTNIGTKQNFQI